MLLVGNSAHLVCFFNEVRIQDLIFSTSSFTSSKVSPGALWHGLALRVKPWLEFSEKIPTADNLRRRMTSRLYQTYVLCAGRMAKRLITCSCTVSHFIYSATSSSILESLGVF